MDRLSFGVRVTSTIDRQMDNSMVGGFEEGVQAPEVELAAVAWRAGMWEGVSLLIRRGRRRFPAM